MFEPFNMNNEYNIINCRNIDISQSTQIIFAHFLMRCFFTVFILNSLIGLHEPCVVSKYVFVRNGFRLTLHYLGFHGTLYLLLQDSTSSTTCQPTHHHNSDHIIQPAARIYLSPHPPSIRKSMSRLKVGVLLLWYVCPHYVYLENPLQMN